MRDSSSLAVSPDDAEVLRARLADDADSSNGRRAHIILLAADGLGLREIAVRLACSERTVATWCERYRTSGLGGLRDAPRTGRPTTVGEAAVVARTLQRPPDDHPRWTSRLLGADLGISNVSVANAWRAWHVRPVRGGHVCLVTDPPVEECIRDVAGIRMGPGTLLLVCATAPLTAATPDGHRPPPLLAPAGDGPDGVERFLSDVRDRHRGGRRLRLLVGGDRDRPAVSPTLPTHAAGSTETWHRLAAIACVAAGLVPAEAIALGTLRDAFAADDVDACRLLLPRDR